MWLEALSFAVPNCHEPPSSSELDAFLTSQAEGLLLWRSVWCFNSHLLIQALLASAHIMTAGTWLFRKQQVLQVCSMYLAVTFNMLFWVCWYGPGRNPSVLRRKSQ